MPKESPCRNDCGTMLHFSPEFKTETGKWIPLERDDTPHKCPKSPYNLKNASATVASAATQQIQSREKPQPTQAAQGPSRYESSYLIPKEEWERMLENSAKITAQLEHLSEFYDSVMQEIEALRNLAYEQQNYRKRQQQQQLAKQEEAYDTAKEDGTLGFD